MQNVLRDIPSSAALTPEPVMDTWEEHQHLMNPMFLQSPDEIDLPPLDPELLEHRRHQVRVIHVVTIRIFLRSVRLVWKVSPRLLFEWITSAENLIGFHCPRTHKNNSLKPDGSVLNGFLCWKNTIIAVLSVINCLSSRAKK